MRLYAAPQIIGDDGFREITAGHIHVHATRHVRPDRQADGPPDTGYEVAESEEAVLRLFSSLVGWRDAHCLNEIRLQGGEYGIQDSPHQ